MTHEDIKNLKQGDCIQRHDDSVIMHILEFNYKPEPVPHYQNAHKFSGGGLMKSHENDTYQINSERLLEEWEVLN